MRHNRAVCTQQEIVWMGIAGDYTAGKVTTICCSCTTVIVISRVSKKNDQSINLTIQHSLILITIN
jgi:hypothetical protein